MHKAAGHELQDIALPDLTAAIIYNGHSYEIMDGEVSNIPRTWLQAVFEALDRMTNGKMCSAVSVLGLQSSGKSTLLNAMYGIDFSVSAG